MLVLTVRVPGEPPKRQRVDQPGFTLGRASSNDLPLGDRTLSRHHARIERTEEGGLLVVDLGSRNGTSVNGERIDGPVGVQPGDRIRLGETTIDVSEESTTRVVIDARESSGSTENAVFRSSIELLRTDRGEWDARLGADELARLNASLRILNELSRALLAADLSLGQLLGLVLDKVFSHLEPERGVVMLSTDGGAELRPETVRFAAGVEPSEIRLSRTVVQAVIERKNGVVMVDTESQGELAGADSIKLSGITSCLAAPLVAEEKVFGLIYVDSRLGRKTFNEDDLRLLSLIANTAAIKIENVRLQEESVAKHRIEREMALAWEIQKRLLPEREPELPHTRLRGRTVPSRTVSGDTYDFFTRPDGMVDVVVADVCGKGMGASILAASVQAAYQAWAGENFPPDRLCERLNDLIFRRTSPEKFVTLFLAQYDAESGSLLYTNAGHNPGLLVREDGRHEVLGPHGLPLGLFPGRRYGSAAATLRTGDLLVLYTDGITEATNPEEQEFGMERLLQVVLAARSAPLQDIETAIGDALDGFVAGTPYADDRTLVLLQRR